MYDAIQALTNQLRTEILSGARPPGSDLPSTRVLATELKTATRRVLRVYDPLIAEGLVTDADGALGRRVTFGGERLLPALVHLIRTRRLRPGDPLPTVSELATALDATPLDVWHGLMLLTLERVLSLDEEDVVRFVSLRRRRLTYGERAAAALAARILTGAIPAGGRLPARPTLQAEFRLGRRAIGDALGVLNERGFVELRVRTCVACARPTAPRPGEAST